MGEGGSSIVLVLALGESSIAPNPKFGGSSIASIRLKKKLYERTSPHALERARFASSRRFRCPSEGLERFDASLIGKV